MSEKNFIEKYLEDFSSLVKPNADIVQKILEVKNILVENNILVDYISNFGFKIWRERSEDDLAARLYNSAQEFNADAIG